MRPQEELARALTEHASRALQATVRVMGWSTLQRSAGERLLAEASSGAVASPVTLTTAGPAGSTQRFFMIGKDGLAAEDDWVLG